MKKFGGAQDYDPKPCASCGELVQLADRLVVERELIHKPCFKCSYCDSTLRVGECAQELSFYQRYGPRWYCSLVCKGLSVSEKEAKLKQKGIQVRKPKPKN